MADKIRIGVEFEVPAEGSLPAYRDTLWFEEAEYKKLRPQDLAALKQERHDNWKAAVLNPPQPEPQPEPTEEDLRSKLQAAEDALSVLRNALLSES